MGYSAFRVTVLPSIVTSILQQIIAMSTTATLDYAGPDLMHIMKKMADTDGNTDVRDFMALLCQRIDARNILTPAEVSEYEAMVLAGEVQYGEELDDAFSELLPDSLQETAVEDNCSITEQIEIADSHINTLTRLQKTLNDEMRCVTSGMQQLEQQEKAAHYTLVAEEQQCMQLLQRVCSAQEELCKSQRGFAKLAAGLQSPKSAPRFISQLPLEMYRKECRQFDLAMKIMMKRCLESNECSGAEFEGDWLEELEESYSEMKREYVCMSGRYEGKKAAIEKLKDVMNDIETSKLTVSFDDIRTQCLLLEVKVNAGKKLVSLMVQNEVLPVVEERVKVDVLQIRKYRNEYELCKLERSLNETECLARCLETALVDSELLLLLLICERQKLIDMRTLYQECDQEIRVQYLECTSRMERMKELRENKSSNSVIMENPLVQCLVQLFDDKHSGNTPKSMRELKLCVQKLNKDITSQEEKVLRCLIDKHKGVCIQIENNIKIAEQYPCAGLTLQRSTCYNNNVQLLESFQEVVEQIKDKYKGKQVYFLKKSFLKEQRLLWIHFLMDPNKLVFFE